MIIKAGLFRFGISGIEQYPLNPSIFSGIRSLCCETETEVDYNIIFTPTASAERQKTNSASRQYNSCLENGSTTSAIDKDYSFVIDWAARSITAFLHSESAPLDPVFTQFMNAILSICTIRNGGVPLHAAAVSMGDKSVLICGRSGAGKSTLASYISPPCVVLDDDFNLVLRNNNEFTVSASPFGKDGNIYPEKSMLKQLKAIFLNRKSLTPGIQEMAGTAAYREILRNAYHLPSHKAENDQLLENIRSLYHRIPVHRLFFNISSPPKLYIELLFKEK